MLTEKKKIFADEYLICLNATEAAIKAGFSEKTARSQGSRLLTDVDISTYLDAQRQKLQGKIELDQEWVLRRLKEISDRCMTAVPVMVFDYVDKELKQKIDEDTGEGVFEFDSNGANKATELIGKHLGMFITKKVEHSGEIGNPQLNFFPASQKPKDE